MYKPIHVLFNVDQVTRCFKTPAENVVLLEKMMKEIHDLAWKKFQASVLFSKRDYDNRLFQASYTEGDLVYILDPSNIPGISTKLQLFDRIKWYPPVLYMV